jgi:hypothetical protein
MQVDIYYTKEHCTLKICAIYFNYFDSKSQNDCRGLSSEIHERIERTYIFFENKSLVAA